MNRMTERTPDILAATSGFFASAAWLADFEHSMQIAAITVAVIAGLASAWSNIERALKTRKERKKQNGKTNSD